MYLTSQESHSKVASSSGPKTYLQTLDEDSDDGDDGDAEDGLEDETDEADDWLELVDMASVLELPED